MTIKEASGSAPRTLECGSASMKEQFLFDPQYRNLNHGSFGTFPKVVRDKLRQRQDELESCPDVYIRYKYPKILDASRAAVAKVLNVDTNTCVFVPNATTGVNCVLRNLTFKPKDVIIYFPTTYGACSKTVRYITETTPAEEYQVQFTYPVSDSDICQLFEQALADIRAAGNNPKVAVIDSIVSLPGVRVPFEQLTAICRRNGVLSLIDGAHGVGHIPIDLRAIDPDFFVSNCHKWLFVPRGCAVFYVPERNQPLMRTSLPTSHGFEPLPGGVAVNNPLPPSEKSPFERLFQDYGTIDNAPFTLIPDALEFRASCTWQDKKGEEAIMAFNLDQARKAGDLVSKILGTDVLDNKEGTLRDCAFSNVRLPLDFDKVAEGDAAKAIRIAVWFAKILVDDYNTFIAVIFYNNAWWVRLSGQVYLTMDDWQWAGEVLKKVCQRIESGEALK